MFRLRPEIEADEGASAVKGFKNGQRKQEIAQRPLVEHDDPSRQGRFQGDDGRSLVLLLNWTLCSRNDYGTFTRGWLHACRLVGRAFSSTSV